MITKKEIKKLDELYQRAIDRYLDKTDFDLTDWLDEDEKREYQRLHFKEDSLCVLCGEPEKMYWCEECESSREKGGRCDECGQKILLDKKYHNEC